jgi:hypothetical protein
MTALFVLILVHGVMRPMLISTSRKSSAPARPSELTSESESPIHAAGLVVPSRSVIATPSQVSTPLPREGCGRIRRNNLLLYAAHSGFGNQELSLRRALLVAYALNRTLVLPPLLQQADLSFGPPEVRCRNTSWQAYMQAQAEQLYTGKGSTDGAYESLLSAYDFSELERLGMHFADFRHVAPKRFAGAALAPVGCTKHDRYTARELRATLKPLHDAAAVRLGSAYFLKADLQGLRASDSCFKAISHAALRLPFVASIERVAAVAIRRLRQPFAAIHVRLADGGLHTATSMAAVEASMVAAHEQLGRELHWLRVRLSKRLAPVAHSHVYGGDLYVASNAAKGSRSPLLAPLCRGVAGSVDDDNYTAGRFSCTDFVSLGIPNLPEWHRLLHESSLSAASAALLVDQQVAAAATAGFFSTSKFCGPAGYRKSTFSEGIALRWQLQHHDGDPPLCAHAMEYALLQGKAAHSVHVY